MTEIAAFDGLLIVHAEDPGGDRGTTIGHRSRHYADFLDSRPPEAETTAIEHGDRRGPRDRLPGPHRAPVQRRGAARDRAARADGVRLTVETCPHYLTLAAEDIADGQTQFKCCPPVRGAANAELLWAGAGRRA